MQFFPFVGHCRQLRGFFFFPDKGTIVVASFDKKDIQWASLSPRRPFTFSFPQRFPQFLPFWSCDPPFLQTVFLFGPVPVGTLAVSLVPIFLVCLLFCQTFPRLILH